METRDKYEHTIELPMNFHKVFVVWLLIAAVLSVPIALYLVCDTLINFDILTSAFTYNPIVTILYIISIILTWIRIPLHIKAYTAMSEMQYHGILLFNKALVVNIAINVLSGCPWTSGIIEISGYLVGAFIAWLIYYIPINIYYKKRAYLFNPPEALKEKTYNDYIIAVEKYKTRHSPLEAATDTSIVSNETKPQVFSSVNNISIPLNSNTTNPGSSIDKNEKVKIKVKLKKRPSKSTVNNNPSLKSDKNAIATSNTDIKQIKNTNLRSPTNISKIIIILAIASIAICGIIRLNNYFTESEKRDEIQNATQEHIGYGDKDFYSDIDYLILKVGESKKIPIHSNLPSNFQLYRYPSYHRGETKWDNNWYGNKTYFTVTGAMKGIGNVRFTNTYNNTEFKILLIVE